MHTLLMLGDAVGEAGVAAVVAALPGLKARYRPDLITLNGENAAGGYGLERRDAEKLIEAGVDVLTGGNHSWEAKDAAALLDSSLPVLRPANYPPGAPGRGWLRLEAGGVAWLVVNLQGREGMRPIDCPFRGADAALAANGLGGAGSGDATPGGSGAPAPGAAAAHRPLVVVDFHAESFVEKQALAWYLDGRASVVAGTHTHVQTMDERILPRGAAYLGDLGMCGPVDSVIGMDAGVCLRRNLSQMPLKMECATGPCEIRGAVFRIDDAGRCAAVERVALSPGELR